MGDSRRTEQILAILKSCEKERKRQKKEAKHLRKEGKRQRREARRQKKEGKRQYKEGKRLKKMLEDLRDPETFYMKKIAEHVPEEPSNASDLRPSKRLRLTTQSEAKVLEVHENNATLVSTWSSATPLNNRATASSDTKARQGTLKATPSPGDAAKATAGPSSYVKKEHMSEQEESDRTRGSEDESDGSDEEGSEEEDQDKDCDKNKPGFSRRALWTPVADALLREGVEKYRAQGWERVAEHVGGGRTALQCRNRWHHYLSKTQVKKINPRCDWSTSELELLETLGSQCVVKSHLYNNRKSIRRDYIDWVVIAERMNRTPIDCYNRWKALQDAKLKHGYFSSAEDALIKLRVEEWGG